MRLIEVIHNVYHWQRDQPYFTNLRSRCIDHFVAVSDFVRDYARSTLLIAPARLHVIENGLSRQGLIRPLLPKLTRQRKATCDRPVLAHLANAHPQKNHIALLRAFGRLLQERPDATLVLAGGIDSSTDVGRRVEAEIETLALNGRVRRTGPLDRRAVSHLLADAHVGLLPSGFEGFSIGSLEYAYFGLPSILSNTGRGPPPRGSLWARRRRRGGGLPARGADAGADRTRRARAGSRDGGRHRRGHAVRAGRLRPVRGQRRAGGSGLGVLLDRGGRAPVPRAAAGDRHAVNDPSLKGGV